MNQTCVILVLFFAFVSCTLSSYLDIPAPPERPIRFKTKEQIENYLKAVKDYYDAFKVKLVRREKAIFDPQPIFDQSNTEDSNEQLELFKRLYYISQPKYSFWQQRRRENQNRI